MKVLVHPYEARRRQLRNMAVGFVLAAVVVVALLSSTAHAQAGADPCAPGYDADAGVPLQLGVALPDGGTEDVPAAICQGQRAPAHGVFLTVHEAAKRAGERAGMRQENASLRLALQRADTTAPALLGSLAGIASTVLVIWCTTHDCNPVHAVKK